MELFSIQNRRTIEEQLKKLGFTNYSEIIKGAVENAELSTLKEKIVEMDDFGNDSRGIDYMFFLAKSKGSTDWHLRTIQAYLIMDTVRNVEGVIPIGKSYSLKDGLLPSKDQIRTALLEMLRKEQVVEDRAVAEMYAKLRYNKNVDRHLRSLGFTNYKEMLLNPSFLDDCTLLTCKQKASLPTGEGSEEFVFRFGFSYDEKRDHIDLVTIQAALEGPVEINGSERRMIYVSIPFGINGCPLKTKGQMKSDLLRMAELKKLQIQMAGKIIQATSTDDWKENTKRGLTGTQRRLRL